ncbi:hypothetical protein QF036_005090 [Arthrobacter globiformis]|nr:hypothetical protein [Arthrobacter globiformis]
MQSTSENDTTGTWSSEQSAVEVPTTGHGTGRCWPHRPPTWWSMACFCRSESARFRSPGALQLSSMTCSLPASAVTGRCWFPLSPAQAGDLWSPLSVRCGLVYSAPMYRAWERGVLSAQDPARLCCRSFQQGAPPDDVQHTRSDAAIASWRPVLHLRKEPAMATSHAHQPLHFGAAAGSGSRLGPVPAQSPSPSICPCPG